MYKKLYYRLFNTITDALNESDIKKLKEILRNGQLETEEIFMNEESTYEKTVSIFDHLK